MGNAGRGRPPERRVGSTNADSDSDSGRTG